MITRTVTPGDLARLKAAREEADRLYNEALTALDASVQRISDIPHPPPPPDEHQITTLNERWNLLAEPPGLPSGWRGRLAAFVWRLVSPYFEKQVAFNSAVVDHANRNLPVQRTTTEAVGATVDWTRDRIDELVTFETRLICYLQQVTPYLDTKDYEGAALARRLHEDNRELIDLIDHKAVALLGAVSGVMDDVAKRWESMVARERRYDARTTAIEAAHDDLRASIGVLQQAAHTLKREVERLRTAPAAQAGSDTTEPVARSLPESSAFQQAQATTIDSYKYVGFEDQFRGDRAEIRARLEAYLPLFDGASDVLDLGCGRGEFLDLLTARGISCQGLDLNHEMVEVCRARGLDVHEGDALGYLRSLPDGSLGGLLAAQVVEHLDPDYLLSLLDVAFHKLRPGATIVLETINVACWFAFFASYIRDLTHVRPVHPDTLRYFVQASGFQRVRIQYSAPYPEHEKLQVVRDEGPIGQTVNANVERLNALLFTSMDYAVIAERV